MQQCPRVYPPASDSRVSCGVGCSGVAQSHRDTSGCSPIGPYASGSTVAASRWCSRWSRAATDSAGHRSTPAHPSRSRRCDGPRVQPAIPRQRRHQPSGESLDAARERPHDRLRLFPRDPDQADVARAPLHQRRDIGIPRAHEQVAFPVSRHRAVLDGGRPCANRDGIDDMPARMGRRPFRPAIRPPLPKVGQQRLFQHAAALHKQTEIDRLVRHVHGRIIRIRLTEPTGDLLRRPLERELRGYRPTQHRVRRQATALRTPGACPRSPVSGRGPIPTGAAVAPYFPTHRRRGPPQVPGTIHGPRRGRSPPARTGSTPGARAGDAPGECRPPRLRCSAPSWECGPAPG